MKRASITQTKNHLSALIDAVRQGESVLILDRGKPVARLEPVCAGDVGAPRGYLTQLERQGIIRQGRIKPARLILSDRPPKAKKGASIINALLANREDER